jgi:hypothetical protein
MLTPPARWGKKGVSKTLPVSVGRVFKAFAEVRQRNRWLERGTLKVRTTNGRKSIRFDFRDGASRMVAAFDPKDRARTTVTIQHEKLRDAGDVEEMRDLWKESLKRLGDAL